MKPLCKSGEQFYKIPRARGFEFGSYVCEASLRSGTEVKNVKRAPYLISSFGDGPIKAPIF